MVVLERFYGGTIKLNKYIIEVIGFLLGDGTIKENMLILACNNKKIIYDLFDKIKSFNVRYASLKIYFWKNPKWKPTYFIHVYDKIFLLLTNRFINILDFLLRKNREYSSLFLRGFIHAEGSVIRRRDGFIKEIKIANSDLYYIKLVEIALQNLGFRYHVNIDSRRDQKHKRDYYYVRIYGTEAEKLYSLLNLLK